MEAYLKLVLLIETMLLEFNFFFYFRFLLFLVLNRTKVRVEAALIDVSTQD